MSTLTLNNVSYQYKNAQSLAVNDVCCEFKSSVLYGVVGPSGSGKSTLLSLLAGLDLPSQGDIKLGQESLKSMDLDQYRRERVSVIFQAFHLFPLLTVLENVCYPMELSGIHPKNAKPYAESLLRKVGITKEQMNRYPSHLSGGEQQRVAIARSLSSGAKILLADEPTGNLDTSNSENIMHILKQLAHEEGYCVIIVTHDLELAKGVDQLYRMKDGALSLVSC